MTSQQRHIEQMLSDAGWQVVQRQQPRDPWWLDEQWIAESTWSPQDARCYVSFVVDPLAPTERAVGTHVWAVAVGTTPPDSHNANSLVSLRTHWDRDGRPQVAALIDGLRAP